jgi:hypothetical protein
LLFYPPPRHTEQIGIAISKAVGLNAGPVRLALIPQCQECTALEPFSAIAAALGFLPRDDHETVISTQRASPRQFVARRKQKSSRLALRLFVDAPRERDDLTAATASALASDLHYRADACELFALAHVLLLSVSSVPHHCQLDELWVAGGEQAGCKRAAKQRNKKEGR